MDAIEKIQKLKQKLNAVILAHNYQLPQIQDIADYRGDSLGLSIEAAKTKADVIVFCGVYFMAETAKILSPQKTVLIPDRHAGCPMADMITADQLRTLKKEHPSAKALCYVNSSAEVKAECDVCCTSGNALEVVTGAFSEDDEIIFVPDQYLARYTASQIDRHFIFWKGYCPTHARILPEHVRQKRAEHPGALVLVHPECTPQVTALADEVLSTGGMSKYVKQSDCKEFIIGTEEGMVYRLSRDNPDKKFYLISDIAVCPNMKKTTIDKVLYSLENLYEEITLPEDIIVRAQKSIQKMVSYT
jgi:quinolinate synthase